MTVIQLPFPCLESTKVALKPPVGFRKMPEIGLAEIQVSTTITVTDALMSGKLRINCLQKHQL
jgi:hypothetical protein